MTQRRTYTEEEKAEIVAALATGMTQREVAKQFGVPLGTVAVYSAAAKEAHTSLMQENKQVIGAKALGYITASLDSLTAQVKRFGSDDFLANPIQTANAQGLAILHGVLADKVIRFFEAYSGNDDDPV